jgi:hypothetical protein
MTRQELWEDIFKNIMFAYNSYPYDGDPDETWEESVETEIHAASDVADAMVEKIMARRNEANNSAFAVTGSKEEPGNP